MERPRGRFPATAVLLVLLFGTFYILAHRDCSAPVTAGSASTASTAQDLAVGASWRIMRRRDTIKPTGCVWLLLSLLSGDVELNPGPGAAGRDVTLVAQNVQSVKNKLGDLRQSAAELEKFSVIGMTETWLNDTVQSSELESALPSHMLFRRDRVDRVGGGVACFVSRALCPERREALEPKDAEMLVVEMKTSPTLLLAVCYCPPDDSRALAAVMSGLSDVVGAAAGKSVVAVGDFNVPDVTWRAADAGGAAPVLKRRSRRALELVDGCHLAGLTQHVQQPSRGPNFLDLVLSNSQDVVATVRDGVFPSDHKEVVCEVRAVRVPVPVVSRSTALNYKRADWDGLRTALRLAPWNLLDELPVDDATALFYDLLAAAIQDYIPLVHLRRRQPPWFDRALHTALREKEVTHRLLPRTRTLDSEASFREKRSVFKRMVSSKFYEYIQGLVSDLKSNPKRFWTFIKCVKGKHSEMSYLVDGARKITDDRDKAELLNSTFAAKFTDPTVSVLPPAPEYSLDPLRSFHVSEETVREILSSVNRYKACGPDNISARVISECAIELAVPVTKLCKLSVDQGLFPKVWKRANIVPIFKKGAKKLPSNYRSVSLLPLFSKVLERVVFTVLFQHVSPALSDRQHGFVPGRSCSTNLSTMLHTAWSNISAGSQTDVIYTDYSSAFQSVNHKLLLHKLKNSYCVSDQALKWCESYLSGREQRVVVKGKCSQWVPVPSGTPEGGLLSPLMFACFVNDLPDAVQTNTLMFADDAKLYCKVDSDADVRFMQGQIDSLCRWSATWGLSLNPTKCKVLTLTLRREPVRGTYAIGGVELERVTVMRDLGVLLDEKLTFADHVDATVRKANRALGVLMRSLQTGKHGRSLKEQSRKSVMSIYCANVRATLEFCSVVWGGAAEVHMKRIERVQHKFLMWLCARCRVTGPTLQYEELMEFFGVSTLAARREQLDIMFLRNVHRHIIDSPFLLSQFPIAAPTRQLRTRVLFNTPYARVNTVRCGLFCRISKACNAFLNENRDVDVWVHSAGMFKKSVIAYVRGEKVATLV